MHKKVRYHLILSYDGTAFYGWQKQPGKRTIQGVLEQILSRVLSQKINITGAARTDSGVHSLCQWATFDAETNWTAEKLKNILNKLIPEDIAINDIKVAPPDFHARYSAVAKQYEYRILFERNPFEIRYATLWKWKFHTELSKLNEIAEIFVGKHNFSAFGIKKDLRETCFCTICYAKWIKTKQGIKFVIIGDRFLHKMVRAIVGANIDCYQGKLDIKQIKEMLETGERIANFQIVPAKGLCLVKIFGKDDKIEIEKHSIHILENHR